MSKRKKWKLCWTLVHFCSPTNQMAGQKRERERESYREQETPPFLCSFCPQISFILFLSFSHIQNLFPEDFGIILVQPAAAYWCLVVTGHKPKLEQVSSLVCLPRLSPSKQSSKPRTRNLPSKLQVTTKKSPSDCNGGKGGRCSVRRP